LLRDGHVISITTGTQDQDTNHISLKFQLPLETTHNLSHFQITNMKYTYTQFRKRSPRRN